MAKHSNKNKPLKISIVTPFYNEELVVDSYFNEVKKHLALITTDFEIICIDDGSADNTKVNLIKHHQSDSRIKIISFSRNFGKEYALTAGLRTITGDVVIPIDADLQDPPELIAKMVDVWRTGYDIVLAQRESRNEAFCKRVTAYVYYWLLNFLTKNNLPKNVGDFRLLDRKVVDVINLLPEKTRYMKGIFAWAGFKSKILKYNRPARIQGQSSQSPSKLWDLALDGIFSFSSAPLKVWTYIGLIISSFAFLYALFIIVKTLVLGVDWPGYPSLMVAVLFMGGINLFSLGILGEYIARVYKEVKNRPPYIIDESYGIKNNEHYTNTNQQKNR